MRKYCWVYKNRHSNVMRLIRRPKRFESKPKYFVLTEEGIVLFYSKEFRETFEFLGRYRSVPMEKAVYNYFNDLLERKGVQ